MKEKGHNDDISSSTFCDIFTFSIKLSDTVKSKLDEINKNLRKGRKKTL